MSRSNRCAVCMSLAMVVALLAASASAQTPPTARPEARSQAPARTSDSVLQVFRPKSVDANSLAIVLKEALQARDVHVAAERETGTVHLVGPRQDVEHVRRLLLLLDPQRPQSAAAPEFRFKVFPLKHASAEGAHRTLRNLVPQLENVAAEIRTNSLIVSGSPQDFEIAEAILMQLDQPSPKEEAQVTVVRLRHIPAREALLSLERLGSVGLGQAHDEMTNSVILRGDSASLREAVTLLETLDKAQEAPSGPLRLRVVWLVHPELAGEDGSAPPADLADVVKLLKEKVGVGELRTAAQLLINAEAVEGGGQTIFHTSGTALVRSLPTQLEAQGNLRPRAGRSPLLEIEIRTSQGEGSRGGGTKLSTVNTTISAPPGHPVVLGMTPIDSLESVFVIELLADDNDASEPAQPGGGSVHRATNRR